MLPFPRGHYGNPSSDHVYGRLAKAALSGARPDAIVFTGCATEVNNLALHGVTRALREDHRRGLLYSAADLIAAWRRIAA